MTNNDILRQLRYAFDFKDAEMVEVLSIAEQSVNQQQVVNWMKKEDDPDLVNMNDFMLASFLDGLIAKNRGKKEGVMRKPENKLNNNLILRKLKIALDLRDDEMIEVFKLADMRISKSELSAFFRKPGHKHYRLCKDQFLRNFLHGIQKKYRTKPPE